MPRSPEPTKRVLVTGATKGLGSVTAALLAAKGYTVFGAGRDQGALAAMSDGPVIPIAMDVGDPTSIDAARHEIIDRTDGYGVDVVINNAGYALVGPLSQLSFDELNAQLRVNSIGPVAVTNTFLPEMIARGRGRVVNVSSTAGRVTFPFGGAYHASKYALEALSDAQRIELHPLGITVVVVEPGPIATEFSATSLEQLDRFSASPYGPLLADKDAILKRFTTGASSVEDIAKVVVKVADQRRPPARTVTPANGRLLLGVAAVLPTRAMDSMLRRLTKLDKLKRSE
jgi:NAD(P)-dependent dehydrogenase (short-subunit alcohol dehydrogenase family)